MSELIMRVQTNRHGAPDFSTAEPVVRCRDCFHRTHNPNGVWCSVMARYMIGDDDGFCAWGEPKGEER